MLLTLTALGSTPTTMSMAPRHASTDGWEVDDRSDRAIQLADRLLTARPQFTLYASLLQELHRLSQTLDAAAGRTRIPVLRNVRAHSASSWLRAELRQWGAIDPEHPLSEEAQRIVTRIEELADQEPFLLLAHHHARALRDPLGPGPVGCLTRFLLDTAPAAPLFRASPELLDPFFDAVAKMDLPPALASRLRDEAVRAHGMEQRFARAFYRTFALV